MQVLASQTGTSLQAGCRFGAVGPYQNPSDPGAYYISVAANFCQSGAEGFSTYRYIDSSDASDTMNYLAPHVSSDNWSGFYEVMASNPNARVASYAAGDCIGYDESGQTCSSVITSTSGWIYYGVAAVTTSSFTCASLQSAAEEIGFSHSDCGMGKVCYTGGNGGTDPCFAGKSVVTRADGLSVRIDTLKEGDEIVAATADGSLTTGVLSLLSIANPEADVDNFLTLTTAANATVTLTPNHHLPVGVACCSTLKKAKEVSVGEHVWFVEQGKAATTTVITKTVTQGKGLHSPVLTNGAFPIVDDIITSFDSIEKVMLAKYGLASLVAFCKASGTCDTMRGLFK